MNRNDHMAIGTSIGFINSLYLISDKPADKNAKDSAKIFEAVLYTGAAIFGSVAPDMLEPANNPRHRDFFHSGILLFFIIVLYFYMSKKDDEKNQFLYNLGNSFLVGYSSHLITDSSTPAGLPFVGKN